MLNKIKEPLNVCIVGATGLVGQEMLKELELFEEVLDIDLYASCRSSGKIIQTSAKKYQVMELTKKINFAKYDLALFSAGKHVSQDYAQYFAENNCFVIDNSSAFRQDEDKALMTMGVNLSEISNYQSRIIANPNCSTIQSVVVINKLRKLGEIKDIDYTTYQSVSGSGIGGITDLEQTLAGNEPENYDYPIANNLIPQIDVMKNDGYTFEEIKMINETKKILQINPSISATCVRVPLSSGHTVQIRIEFKNEINLEDVYKLLAEQEHLKVLKKSLPMPLYMKNKQHVEVGRIRLHQCQKNVLFLMTVADNLKVGAATNACEIARYLIKDNLC